MSYHPTPVMNDPALANPMQYAPSPFVHHPPWSAPYGHPNPFGGSYPSYPLYPMPLQPVPSPFGYGHMVFNPSMNPFHMAMPPTPIPLSVAAPPAMRAHPGMHPPVQPPWNYVNAPNNGGGSANNPPQGQDAAANPQAAQPQAEGAAQAQPEPPQPGQHAQEGQQPQPGNGEEAHHEMEAPVDGIESHPNSPQPEQHHNALQPNTPQAPQQPAQQAPHQAPTPQEQVQPQATDGPSHAVAHQHMHANYHGVSPIIGMHPAPIPHHYMFPQGPPPPHWPYPHGPGQAPGMTHAGHPPPQLMPHHPGAYSSAAYRDDRLEQGSHAPPPPFLLIDDEEEDKQTPQYGDTLSRELRSISDLSRALPPWEISMQGTLRFFQDVDSLIARHKIPWDILRPVLTAKVTDPSHASSLTEVFRFIETYDEARAHAFSIVGVQSGTANLEHEFARLRQGLEETVPNFYLRLLTIANKLRLADEPVSETRLKNTYKAGLLKPLAAPLAGRTDFAKLADMHAFVLSLHQEHSIRHELTQFIAQEKQRISNKHHGASIKDQHRRDHNRAHHSNSHVNGNGADEAPPRKPSQLSDAPGAQCRVHPRLNHTNSECHVQARQRGQQQPPDTAGSQKPTAASSSSSAPAATAPSPQQRQLSVTNQATAISTAPTASTTTEQPNTPTAPWLRYAHSILSCDATFQGQPIRVLFDNCSTHTLISATAINRLGLRAKSHNATQNLHTICATSSEVHRTLDQPLHLTFAGCPSIPIAVNIIVTNSVGDNSCDLLLGKDAITYLEFFFNLSISNVENVVCLHMNGTDHRVSAHELLRKPVDAAVVEDISCQRTALELFMHEEDRFPHTSARAKETEARILADYPKLFSTESYEAEQAWPVEFRLNFKETPAPHISQFRPPLAYRSIIDEKLQDLLDRKVIAPCENPIVVSPYFLVRQHKPGGDPSYRLVFNFQYLNGHCHAEPSALPDINTLLQELSKHHVFNTTDIRSAYHCIPTSEDARPYLAFLWNNKAYTFLATPFGVVNAAHTLYINQGPAPEPRRTHRFPRRPHPQAQEGQQRPVLFLHALAQLPSLLTILGATRQLLH